MSELLQKVKVWFGFLDDDPSLHVLIFDEKGESRKCGTISFMFVKFSSMKDESIGIPGC
jgi:hypothetical protein